MNTKSLKHFEAEYPFTMGLYGVFVYSYESLVKFLNGDMKAVEDFIRDNKLINTGKGTVIK